MDIIAFQYYLSVLFCIMTRLFKLYTKYAVVYFFFSDAEQQQPLPAQLAVVPPALPAVVPTLEKEMKPYRCSVCSRGFNNEIGLQNHLWSHLPPGRRILTNTDDNYQLQR
jgi:hypothetical protein